MPVTRFAAVLLVVPLLGGLVAAPPSAPEATAVLRDLTARGAQEDPHRDVWRAVLLAARPDLEANRNRAFWASFLDPDRVFIVSLDDPVPVTVGEGLRTRDLDLDRWLVVTPVTAVVVTRPANWNPADTRHAAHKLLTLLAAADPGDKPAVRKDKEARRADLETVGVDGCGRVMVPVATFRGGIDPKVTRVLAGARVRLTVRGKEREVELPSRKVVENRIARPLGPIALPRVLVAIDWSERVADEQNHAWLGAALKSALAEFPEDDLLDGGVHLQTPTKSAVWSLKDVRAGKVPDTLPPHKGSTLPSLEAAVRRAVETPGSTKLVFLTWNPGTSIPREDQGDPPNGPDFRENAGNVELEVVQVLGDRLECFKQLRKDNYYVLEDDDRPSGRRVAAQVRQLLNP